jgi:glucan biosynthesis protein C
MAEPIALSTRSLGKYAATALPATGRMLYVDNIRVMLTILVIVFHLVAIYAGTGDWYYREVREDTITAVLGGWFIGVVQAFSMGLFLVISAYFVPGSYDRKGPWRFLKDRLVRLGIPLALYSWIIRPLLVYLDGITRQGLKASLWEFYTRRYFQDSAFLGDGPLWFIETLLIFSLVYVLWRIIFKARSVDREVQAGFPRSWSVALFALLVGLASFVVRLWIPPDWKVELLNLNVRFFVQYIAMFVAGLVAYRRDWFRRLPDRQGRLWLWIGVALVPLLPVMILVSGMDQGVEPFLGGWHWQAAAWALWESFVCLAFCVGLIYLFRRRGDRQRKVARFLSPNAYTAYLIHGVVVTVLALAVRDVMLYPLLKLVLAIVVAVPVTFALSALVRKVPFADRVL